VANELIWRPAAEQADLVRRGEVTARELVEASLEAIERLNGEINAVVTLAADRALAEADSVQPGDERPLAGVPVLVKDLLVLTEGIRTTMGMAAMEDWTPSADSAYVRRLRGAGAIIVGKTNTPEMGILPVTEPHRFGPTRNPWDTSRTCGGSSGGSAAAIASGMVSLAHGNDGGGSIRIPASCCGLVGLKPSRGRISLAPEYTEAVAGFAVDGVLSRTVQDTALALDVLSGYEPGDPYWASPPSAPFAEAPGLDPGRLRVGFTTATTNRAPVDPECERAVSEAVELLESLGHEVEEAMPEAWDDQGYVENFIKVWMAVTEDEIHTYERLKGSPIDRAELEPLTRQMAEIAGSISATDYLTALDYLRRMVRRIVAFWNRYDILVTPTLAKPPIEIGALEPAEGEPPVQMLANSASWVTYTPTFNVSGQPAVSLPIHVSEDGLPVGVQFVGPPEGEELLLSLSAQLEEAAPWADRRPELALA
jgi:amidase